MIAKATKSKPRAVGYSRTSGPNYTSIDNQKEAIEKFIDNNDWLFIGHYIDECKSGAKTAGRDDFQRMMKDATKDSFDVIVPYDISRFARDGCDIISNAKFLKNTFGIFVVDSKYAYDNRTHDKVLLNYVHAGEAEAERLRIMERTIKGGRIKRAEQGTPWSATPPFGRAYDEESDKWYVTDEGKKFAELLERYANGEQVKRLAQEYNMSSVQRITRIVRESQLSANDFKITFNSPEIGIVNHVVTIPNFPKVITPQLEKRVRERMKYNRKWNKQHTQRTYLLSGFVYCAHCGKALKGQTQHKKHGDIVYYRHNNYLAHDKRDCKYRSIKADILENHVLDYLYNFFLDVRSYKQAIKAALPSDIDRKALLQDIKNSEKRLAQSDKKISNLVNAIAAGADVSMLINKQNELKAEKQALENRLEELNQTLAGFPDPKIIEQQASLLQARLILEFFDRDWRKLSYKDIHNFLNFLFSDNPREKGYGIFVAFDKNQYKISFNGRFDFNHDIVNGQAVFPSNMSEAEKTALQSKIDDKTKSRDDFIKANKEYIETATKVNRLAELIEKAKKYEQVVQESKRELKQLKRRYEEIKPEKDYL